MAEFIVNPRRAARAPARCRATVVVAAIGAFEAETEDIGSMGCQVVSPRLVRKNDLVQLAVLNDKVPEPLRVSGRVAWVSPQAPWRVGIAFDERSLPESAHWWERLIAAYPGMSGYRRVPERIRADSTVYLGPPPRFLLDFNAEEALLLRAIGSGARVDELMARLRDRWPAMQRALFSLIARQAITFQRGQSAHPDTWKKILSDVEASLAVDALGSEGPPAVQAPAVAQPARPAPTPAPVRTPSPAWPTATPVPSATPWAPVPPRDPSRSIDLDDGGPPLELATATPAPRGAGRVDGGSWGAPEAPRHSPDFSGAGVGWRKPARRRSPEAQAVFDRALAEIAAGNVNGAIALLRRALALSPGDPEVADQLGKLAFKDRLPGV